MRDMNQTVVSRLSIYATDLLKLVFSEDRAALYLEGFEVLSTSPAVGTELGRLQDETNLHLVRVLELFQTADMERTRQADSLEAAVAEELAASVNAASLGNADDADLLRASLRLGKHLLSRYEIVAEHAFAMGLDSDRKRLASICEVKRERLRQLSSLLDQLVARREGALVMFSPAPVIYVN